MDSLKADILGLSDDDFGSKYGRDRTAREAAMRDANDAARYKDAEADYKKERAQTRAAENRYFGEKEAKTGQGKLDLHGAQESIKNFREFKEGKIDAKELGERSRSIMRGGASMGSGGSDIEGLKMNKNVKPKLKSGGKVSSASKRADGCAIKGKTKGRMV